MDNNEAMRIQNDRDLELDDCVTTAGCVVGIPKNLRIVRSLFLRIVCLRANRPFGNSMTQ
jgi:hypothetical protein